MGPGIALHQGDCLEVMGGIPDRSIPLILADLPYGITAHAGDVMIPMGPLWGHYKRLLSVGGTVLLTASQPFTSMLVMSNPDWFRYCLVWDKSSITGWLDAKRKPLKCHEDLCVFARGPSTYHPQMWRGAPNHGKRSSIGKPRTSLYVGPIRETESDMSGNKYPRSIIRVQKHPSREKLHPSQKPVALMEYLIRTYSNEGERVLDNAMGSGTTGIACINTGRHFIGIERHGPYFEVARRRIDAEVGRTALFGERPD